MVKKRARWYTLIFIIFNIVVRAYGATDFISLVLLDHEGKGGGSFKEYGIINTPEVLYYQDSAQYNYVNGKESNDIVSIDSLLLHKTLEQKIILYGIGKGASTALHWVAQKSRQEQRDLIACLVIESLYNPEKNAFAHALHSCEMKKESSHIFSRISKLPSIKQLLPSLASSLLNVAKNISPDIPVVIMHNNRDASARIHTAYQLYNTLVEQNNSNIYLFETDNQPCIQSDLLMNEDREVNHLTARVKIEAMQVLYKKYALPHQEIIQNKKISFAEKDEQTTLAPYQPSTSYISKRLHT